MRSTEINGPEELQPFSKPMRWFARAGLISSTAWLAIEGYEIATVGEYHAGALEVLPISIGAVAYLGHLVRKDHDLNKQQLLAEQANTIGE